jgi:hypothetical protein
MMPIRMWRAGGGLYGVIKSAGEIRGLLQRAANPPTVRLYPRADGPGSSQDLPQFAAMAGRVAPVPLDLDDPTWAWSRECLRTLGACIDSEPIKYRVVPAADPNAYEYYSPDFHPRPIVARDPLPGRPHLFVHNVLRQLGLRGVRIEASPMPAVLRGSGLGGSNLAHAAALILGSAVLELPLDLSQIYVAATELENHFGVAEVDGALSVGVSLTGGQETLTAFQGGVWDNVHLPIQLGPHGVISREIVAPIDYGALSRHLLLVNVGRRRAPGVTSSGVNNDWIRAWESAEGTRQHSKKINVAWEAAEAMRAHDWRRFCEAVTSYRKIRAALSQRYIAGQDELAVLCARVDATWFPVGAGSGTCLVAAEDPQSISTIREAIESTQDISKGRTTIPFAVRSNGIVFQNFKESGLAVPPLPGLLSAPISPVAELPS